MSNIETIKKIRDMTGFSINEIKKAIGEAGGDQARALEILKSHGAQIASKKSARSTKEGIIECYVHANRKLASVVTILCETDFVAKNPMFKELAHEMPCTLQLWGQKTAKSCLASRIYGTKISRYKT